MATDTHSTSSAEIPPPTPTIPLGLPLPVNTVTTPPFNPTSSPSNLTTLESILTSSAPTNLLLRNSTPSPHTVTNLVTVKLSPYNYYLWSSLMTSYLISTDLFMYVDGTLQAPPTHLALPTGLQVANPPYISWLQTNHSVRASLLATMSPELMLEVYDILPAYDIWSTIRHRFLENTMSRELELRERLLNLRLTTQSMSTYLQDLKTTADQLSSIGKAIPTAYLITYTLRGLPRAYNTLVTTLSYAVTGLTFDQLRANLLTHEQRLKRQDDEDS